MIFCAKNPSTQLSFHHQWSGGAVAFDFDHPALHPHSDHAVPRGQEHCLGVVWRQEETGDPVWGLVTICPLESNAVLCSTTWSLMLTLFLRSIKITTSCYPVPSICCHDLVYDWFESLAQCLHWNVRKRQARLANASDSSDTDNWWTLEQGGWWRDVRGTAASVTRRAIVLLLLQITNALFAICCLFSFSTLQPDDNNHFALISSKWNYRIVSLIVYIIGRIRINFENVNVYI